MKTETTALWGGGILIVCGLVWLVGAVCGWRWLLEGSRNVFGIAWIAETFGSGLARWLVGIVGLVVAAVGIVWIATSAGMD